MAETRSAFIGCRVVSMDGALYRNASPFKEVFISKVLNNLNNLFIRCAFEYWWMIVEITMPKSFDIFLRSWDKNVPNVAVNQSLNYGWICKYISRNNDEKGRDESSNSMKQWTVSTDLSFFLLFLAGCDMQFFTRNSRDLYDILASAYVRNHFAIFYRGIKIIYRRRVNVRNIDV